MSTDEAFTVTNQLSSERPQVVAKELVEPSPALSDYAMFFKETQVSIRSENPEASIRDLKTIVDTMWQALGDDQKKKYREMSEQDKVRFENEKAEFLRLKEQQRQAGLAFRKTVITPVPNSNPVKPINTPAPPGGKVCIRLGCDKQSIANVEWEDEYCSPQCVVLHCDFVFREWVREQQSKA